MVIEGEPGRTVRAGKALDPETRARMVEVLREYQDVFAYEASEMPGLDPKIMCHEHNIKEGYKPVKQTLRHQGPERCKAAVVEVKKLLEAGFIEECPVLRMVGQRGIGQAAEWGLAHVRGFHIPEQGLSKG